MAFISILIPAYNDAEYLHGALSSALEQSFAELEIIVVDDGSTDGSRAIIEEFAAQDNRITPLFFEQNSGSFVARKRAVEAATGTYTLFLDADDTLEPSACAKMRAAFDMHQVDILQFNENILRIGDAPDRDYKAMVAFVKPYSGTLQGDNLAAKCFIERNFSWTLCGKAIRTSLLQEAFAALPDDRFVLSEDVYMVFALLTYARSYHGLGGAALYNYYWGRGITGNRRTSLDKFNEICTEPLIAKRLQEFVAARCATSQQQAVINVITQRFVHAAVDAWLSFDEPQREQTLDTLLATWPERVLMQEFAEQNAIQATANQNMTLTIENLQTRLAAMEHTLSWRITRPLRALKRALRR